ncbi:MAG: ATPase central domain protein [Bacteroidota bacterium]|jgi:SpoVK/Ycf46/Vps4 family AAA+-type ATPase|nr:ATPase central domain protein [Bacteroidota bacterium]
MAKNYKFKDMKVYSSDEWMANATKKYRTVFDRAETTYLRTEFAFYNKLFDEQDWQVKINLKCFEITGGTRKELCSLDYDQTISMNDNVVYVRDGWGNAIEGAYWFRGEYLWEGYIDGELVGSKKFFVEEVGKVTTSSNPYFSVDSVKLFSGPFDGWNIKDRTYYKKLNRNQTPYLWVEFKIRTKTAAAWNYEFFFNFYDDAGQAKGQTLRTGFIEANKNELIYTFDAGWGSESAGSWKDDKYTVEIVFMDTLVALVPFEIGNDSEEGTMTPFVSIEEGLSTAAKTAEVMPVVEEETIEQLLAKLDELIGMDAVKKNIRDHINYINFIKLRKEKGFTDGGRINLHSVFTGNPGTGKTTVVNMLGKLYKKMGLLSKGHVKEVDRSDLVAQYIGQTAPKVKKAIEEAKGGILFIDEAYSLTRAKEDSNDFGHEVLEILIKEMSDGTGDIAIMCAGYPKEMQHFVDANPGLKSRFNHYFHFDDYMPEEMFAIAELAASKKGVIITDAAKNFMQEMLVEVYRTRDNSFGNARYVYSLVDEAKMNLGLRLMSAPNVSEMSNEQLSTIELADMQKVFASQGKKKLSLEVNEKLLKEGLAELNSLTGMNNVKEEINELVKLVRFYKETGRDVLNKFSLHSIFTGNPGTGKTTVARIVAKIYKGLGLLERGHIVEVDRESLVAGYIGQTAIKTGAKIDEAQGGILFIDEAYALAGKNSNESFGQEAIQVILKRMEDLRGQFGVIVAGYTDNMHEFIESNPGLKSRFDRTFHFGDYTPEDMTSIALNLLAKEKITPDVEAYDHLKSYFAHIHVHRDKHFGNARTVRQVIAEAIKNQNLRLAEIPSSERTPLHLATLTLSDVKEFEIGNPQRTAGGSLGFKIGG